jgi:hypothetical protein
MQSMVEEAGLDSVRGVAPTTTLWWSTSPMPSAQGRTPTAISEHRLPDRECDD